MTRYALLLLAFATTARADVWNDAVARGRPDPNRDTYNRALKDGDDAVTQSLVRSASLQTIKSKITAAIMAYQEAATAEPNEAEPYFRIAMVLFSHYFSCDSETIASNMQSPLCDPNPYRMDRRKAEQVIAAWNAAEQRAPLDPRFTVVGGSGELLFQRAILNTKLATKASLEAAARDYEAFLARSDEDGRTSLLAHETRNNLAETYMMLDRLDQAIDMYKEALRHSPSAETAYGLAVALDRDERTGEALGLIRDQGQDAFREFYLNVMKGSTFFVPAGEQHYYFALIDEAYGQNQNALDQWQAFIDSGAHPEFQPRAKQHIEALHSEQKKHPIPYPGWSDEPFRRFGP